MNKNPVMVILTVLSVVGLILAVGIFTKIRMAQESLITDVHQPHEQAPLEQAPSHADISAAQAAAASAAQIEIRVQQVAEQEKVQQEAPASQPAPQH